MPKTCSFISLFCKAQVFQVHIAKILTPKNHQHDTAFTCLVLRWQLHVVFWHHYYFPKSSKVCYQVCQIQVASTMDHKSKSRRPYGKLDKMLQPVIQLMATPELTLNSWNHGQEKGLQSNLIGQLAVQHILFVIQFIHATKEQTSKLIPRV